MHLVDAGTVRAKSLHVGDFLVGANGEPLGRVVERPADVPSVMPTFGNVVVYVEDRFGAVRPHVYAHDRILRIAHEEHD